MSKDLIPASDSHNRLTTEALPAAVKVLVETMQLDPWEEKEDEATGEVKRTLNLRINGQRVRAALGTVSIVERLGDQALRRQAGGDLRKMLKEIKALSPDIFKKPKVIEG